MVAWMLDAGLLADSAAHIQYPMGQGEQETPQLSETLVYYRICSYP